MASLNSFDKVHYQLRSSLSCSYSCIILSFKMVQPALFKIKLEAAEILSKCFHLNLTKIFGTAIFRALVNSISCKKENFRGFLKKSFSQRFCKIHRKRSVIETFFRLSSKPTESFFCSLFGYVLVIIYHSFKTIYIIYSPTEVVRIFKIME